MSLLQEIYADEEYKVGHRQMLPGFSVCVYRVHVQKNVCVHVDVLGVSKLNRCSMRVLFSVFLGLCMLQTHGVVVARL